MGLRISDATASIAYLSDEVPHDLGSGPHGFGHAAADYVAGLSGARPCD